MAHWPGGLPTLRTQLNTGAATHGEDCGPLACINATECASDGKVGPRYQKDVADTGDDVRGWVRLMRAWANNATKPFMFPTDFMDALTDPDLARIFNQMGLPRLRPQAYSGGTWDTMKKWLRLDYPVILAVDYGVLNAGKAPTGDPAFDEGHVIVLAGSDVRKRLVYVNDGDSLFDGRRAGIPKGWTETRLRYLKAAAARFGSSPPGTDKADFIVVRGGSHG
jgi:hypothetical protein